ncbi:unnamed protein product [Amoebophrya sp. A25]|nr:unnamed protein product [Amoebophrya sp. A25]|eukprot:GSA25T00017988001.1
MVNNRKFRALVLAGSLAEAERVRAIHIEADEQEAGRPHMFQRKNSGRRPSTYRSIHPSAQPSDGKDSDPKNAFLEVFHDTTSLMEFAEKALQPRDTAEAVLDLIMPPIEGEVFKFWDAVTPTLKNSVDRLKENVRAVVEQRVRRMRQFLLSASPNCLVPLGAHAFRQITEAAEDLAKAAMGDLEQDFCDYVIIISAQATGFVDDSQKLGPCDNAALQKCGLPNDATPVDLETHSNTVGMTRLTLSTGNIENLILDAVKRWKHENMALTQERANKNVLALLKLFSQTFSREWVQIKAKDIPRPLRVFEPRTEGEGRLDFEEYFTSTADRLATSSLTETLEKLFSPAPEMEGESN